MALLLEGKAIAQGVGRQRAREASDRTRDQSGKRRRSLCALAFSPQGVSTLRESWTTSRLLLSQVVGFHALKER